MRFASDTPLEIDLDAFQELLDESGLVLKATRNSYVTTCPRCNKREKLYIYRSGRGFKCFSCDRFSGGVHALFIEVLRNRPAAEIKRRLYGVRVRGDQNADAPFRFGDDVGDVEVDAITTHEEDDQPGIEWPSLCRELTDPKGLPGLKYLVGRGISPDLAAEYDIRYYAPQRAVCFPVEYEGTLYGWQYRLTYEPGPGELKTWSTEGIPASRLMFEDRLHDSSHAVIVEGPVDALKAHLFGGNVATMGKGTILAKIAAIKAHSTIKRVYLGLDPDAFTTIDDVVRALHPLEVFKVEIPKGYKDLGQMSLDHAAQTIADAQRVYPGDLHVWFP